MKGTFNQGWWNCFESFASMLLDERPAAEGFCTEVLKGAGITAREAQAWLNKPVNRDPRTENVVRDYLYKHAK